jgi:hypothetical protein
VLSTAENPRSSPSQFPIIAERLKMVSEPITIVSEYLKIVSDPRKQQSVLL